MYTINYVIHHSGHGIYYNETKNIIVTNLHVIVSIAMS